ncbi:hypothetical protein MRX96_015362 [Rhipicephalus microplus]|uniref:Putative carrier protein n=1 Tax=Rhipicephalus microplus TaxID=6941 RepID=A0A6M2CPL2_RHIMP
MASQDNITASQRMICSCTGALTTSFFVTPLDVVKIRLQAQRKQLVRNKCFLYCNGLMEHMCYCLNGNGNGLNGQQAMIPPSQWYKRPGHFNGTLDAFIKIARNEGVTSLWSGLPPTLVMAVPATVIYFTVYDQIREFFSTHLSGHKTVWAPALSGGLARVFSATVISPLEMVRTKMQSKRLSYLEIGQAVKSLVKRRGVLSLYVGLGPTLLRDVPFSCFYWTCYENLKLWYKQEQPTFLFSFTAGAAAGTAAAVVTLPFDVVKTHRQIELGEMEILKENKPSSTLSVMRELYRTQGLRSLFAGIVPRVSKVAPACAIMISTYEFGKKFFRQKNAARASGAGTSA